MNTQQAYNEGRDAFRLSGFYIANPYSWHVDRDREIDLHLAWEKGYLDALEEEVKFLSKD